MVYAAEQAPPDRRALVTSATGLGSIGGMLLGSGVGAVVSAVLHAEGVDAWGWRIPFLLGAVLGAAGILLRRGLTEVEAPAAAHPHEGTPLVVAVRGHWPDLLRLVGVICLSGAGFYLLFVYSVTYLNVVLHQSMRTAFDINTASIVLLLLAYPAGAALSDRLGRRPVLAIFAALMLVLAWPLYRLLHSGDPWLVLAAQCGLTLVLGPFIGVIPVVLVEAFPRALRCSAVGLAYNVAMAIFGGLAPAAATWLIARTADDMMPAAMLMAAAAVSLVAALSLRETAGHRLG
jgi:MHS family proline/betaine transporter-like MFS transporter